MADLNWADCLIIGIKSVLNIQKTEIDELQEKIVNARGILHAMEIELNNMLKEKQQANTKESEKEFDSFKRDNPLRYMEM